MKLFAFYFLLLGIAFGEANSLQPEKWPVATVFPSTPTVTEGAPTANTSYSARARAAKGGAAFGLQRLVFRFENTPKDVYSGYHAGKELMLKSKPARLIEEEKIFICGFPALRYVIEYEEGKRRVEFRDVLVTADGRFEGYLFMYDYSTDSPMNEDAANFFGKAAKRD